MSWTPVTITIPSQAVAGCTVYYGGVTWSFQRTVGLNVEGNPAARWIPADRAVLRVILQDAIRQLDQADGAGLAAS